MDTKGSKKSYKYPNANQGIEMTRDVRARQYKYHTPPHHTRAVVKEVGVRLERTATQCGGGPYLANLQMVNLTVNGPTFSITTLNAGEEREVCACVRWALGGWGRSTPRSTLPEVTVP